MIEQGQSPKRQRPEAQPEIPQRDIEVVPHQEQIDDDSRKPRRHYRCANLWLERDQKASDHFDNSDDMHESAGPADKVANRRPKILCPIGESHHKFVQARNHRSRYKSPVENLISLMNSIALCVLNGIYARFNVSVTPSTS